MRSLTLMPSWAILASKRSLSLPSIVSARLRATELSCRYHAVAPSNAHVNSMPRGTRERSEPSLATPRFRSSSGSVSRPASSLEQSCSKESAPRDEGKEEAPPPPPPPPPPEKEEEEDEAATADPCCEKARDISTSIGTAGARWCLEEEEEAPKLSVRFSL